jgi:hypothetical protein
MLTVARIIAVFTMVWSVGLGIADEKNGLGTRIVAIRSQAVDGGASKASTVWRQVATCHLSPPKAQFRLTRSQRRGT